MLARNNINKIKIIGLLLVFIIPMMVSWFLYAYHDYFHFQTTNHGTLLTPPLHDESFIAGVSPTWQLVYAPTDCQSKDADTMMFTLHELRLLLGKDSKRVSLTLLTENNCGLANTHDFRKLTFNSKQLREKLADHRVSDKIFLIDPRGNLFMYYVSSTPLANVFKDIKHVLEVSQIG
jgi:hypothetical protein